MGKHKYIEMRKLLYKLLFKDIVDHEIMCVTAKVRKNESKIGNLSDRIGFKYKIGDTVIFRHEKFNHEKREYEIVGDKGMIVNSLYDLEESTWPMYSIYIEGQGTETVYEESIDGEA